MKIIRGIDGILKTIGKLPGCFPIGSRVWGGASEKSDYDFAVLTTSWEKFVANLRDKGYEFNMENKFSSYGVKDGEHKLGNEENIYIYANEACTDVVNILCYDLHNLLVTKVASDSMIALKGSPIGKLIATDKNARCEIFQCFLAVANEFDTGFLKECIDDSQRSN